MLLSKIIFVVIAVSRLEGMETQDMLCLGYRLSNHKTYVCIAGVRTYLGRSDTRIGPALVT